MPTEEALPHCAVPPEEVVEFGVVVALGGPQERTGKVEGSPDFVAPGGAELVRKQNHPHHLGKLIGSLPVGVEDVRRGLHQTLRGVVADQTAAELAADVAGCAGMIGEDVQDDIAVIFAQEIFDNLAHHHFCVGEVAGRVEFEETRIAVDASR